MKNNYHYYQETQEDLHSNPAIFDFHFKSEAFRFHTDDGVFSKHYIDYGSFVLLNKLVMKLLQAIFSILLSCSICCNHNCLVST